MSVVPACRRSGEILLRTVVSVAQRRASDARRSARSIGTPANENGEINDRSDRPDPNLTLNDPGQGKSIAAFSARLSPNRL